MEICCANCVRDRNEDVCCVIKCLGGLNSPSPFKYFKPKEEPVVLYPIGNIVTERLSNKEGKMKYKWTGKELTAREIIGKSNMTCKEARRYIDWLTYNCVTNMDWAISGKNATNPTKANALLEYATSKSCFREFLLKYDHIEKVEEWKPVKVGDRFTVDGLELMVARYRPNHCFLVIINSELSSVPQAGNFWADKVRVEDEDNISKEEFQKMTGISNIDDFKRL
jgi:hypothetical protein